LKDVKQIVKKKAEEEERNDHLTMSKTATIDTALYHINRNKHSESEDDSSSDSDSS
jgi:hypothetical protein